MGKNFSENGREETSLATPQVMEHIRQLREHIDELAAAAGAISPAVATPELSSDHMEFIRTILKLRASRRAVFGPTLFGEPSWDMLLELYDAHYRQRRESVSSLCIASGVPATTALRWIGTLESEGWIVRVPDPSDRRRVQVELTQNSLEAMAKVLSPLKLPQAANDGSR